ncbi:hypothetical protein [Actinomadura madurae]|uniref:hypothetical protein n=1 Tax=Actinomadura madurae TaxID=1993 RepID=UPI000DCF68CF|nr:hypothetical protein [Actinomadura madurae]
MAEVEYLTATADGTDEGGVVVVGLDLLAVYTDLVAVQVEFDAVGLQDARPPDGLRADGGVGRVDHWRVA